MREKLIAVVKKIGYAHALHRLYIHKEAADKDIYPGQIHILRLVSENETCTQKELASALRVSAASVAVSVKRMEKNGLILRSEDKKDRRIMHISVTERGKKSLACLNDAFFKVDKKMFDGFSAEEIATLDDYLGRICSNLSLEDTKEKSIYEIVKKTQELEKRKDEDGV